MSADKVRPFLILSIAIVIVAGGLFAIMSNSFTTAVVASDAVQKIYFADAITVAHKAVIDKFNQLHAGKIEVIPVDLPFEKFSTNERKELLARSLRSRSDRIDVFCVDHIWVSRFAKWAEPLNRYFSGEEKKAILSYALESCSYDTMLVAMPLYLDVGVLYYRRDLIRKLPHADQIEQKLRQSITWKELLSLKKYFPDNPLFIYQGDDYEGLVCTYFEMVAGQNRNAFRANAFRLTSPESERALEMLAGFIQRDHVTPKEVVNFKENESYRYWLENNAVFLRGWPGIFRDMKTHPIVQQSAVAPLPRFGTEPPAAVFGGWNLMISRSSVNKDAAATFIKFLLSEQSQKIMYERGGFLPVKESVYRDTAYVASHAGLAEYRTMLDYGFERPALVEYTKVSDIISHYVHRAISGEIPAHDALVQAQSMISSNNILIK
ncbi:MAG: extracellular solute-binding protein [Acidobacteriota bacterium]